MAPISSIELVAKLLSPRGSPCRVVAVAICSTARGHMSPERPIGDAANGNGNLLGITANNTSWPPPIWMSDWLWYYQTDDYTNADVNTVGAWLANRIGTTWTDVTDLAS